jgi:hypothetical protein
MKRQLYQGGGIMGLSKEGIGGGDYKGYDMGSRVGYGIIKKVFRGAKKAVKGAAGAVKDIASSDIGKAALLAGAGMYAGGLGPFASGARFGNVAGAGFLPNLFTGAGIGASTVADGLTAGVGPKRSLLSNLFSKIPGGGITAGIVGSSVLAGLLSKQQMAEIDEADPDERGDIVAEKLRQSLTRLGVSGEELERRVAEGVSEYTGYTSKAEGGRIGYAVGSDGPVLPEDPTKPVNPFAPKPTGPVLPDRMMASNEISIDKIEMLIERGADNDLIKEFTGASDGVIDQIRDAMERKNKAGGGIMNRMNYALGDTASQNAMQAAGIEGLPVRQNPKGVKELDLRDNGGFIPPVGIKEKEDDIPAMLSNNEFVFTADAVRGMGDGDVELGAQRMYDQMKMLEKGGRV